MNFGKRIGENQWNFENKTVQKAKKFDDVWLKFWMLSGAQKGKSCRSRQELSNEYWIGKFSFDTAENEPLKVGQKLANGIQYLDYKLEKNIGFLRPFW